MAEGSNIIIGKLNKTDKAGVQQELDSHNRVDKIIRCNGVTSLSQYSGVAGFSSVRYPLSPRLIERSVSLTVRAVSPASCNDPDEFGPYSSGCYHHKVSVLT